MRGEITTTNADELEQTLLANKQFQHILKFAPQSQRELMTFELAKYFTHLIRQEVLKARKSEASWWHRNRTNPEYEKTGMFDDRYNKLSQELNGGKDE